RQICQRNSKGPRNRVNIYITINFECLHITVGRRAEPPLACVSQADGAHLLRSILRIIAYIQVFLALFLGKRRYFRESDGKSSVSSNNYLNKYTSVFSPVRPGVGYLRHFPIQICDRIVI